MYKQEELFDKVHGHIQEKDLNLLKALVEDLNEFNDKYCLPSFCIYIDFDNEGDYSEYDPYCTFSIRIHDMVNEGKCDENIHDYLDIHQLDDCLCAIEIYEEEKEKLLWNISGRLSS